LLETGLQGLRPPPTIRPEFDAHQTSEESPSFPVGYRPAEKMLDRRDRNVAPLDPPVTALSLPPETIFRRSGIERQRRPVSHTPETG